VINVTPSSALEALGRNSIVDAISAPGTMRGTAFGTPNTGLSILLLTRE
jgi:hypothetical protein